MTAYTVNDLRRDLELQLAPHNITVGIVVATEHDLTIEARRVSGTDVHRLFTLTVTKLWPATAVRFAELVRDYYAALQ